MSMLSKHTNLERNTQTPYYILQVRFFTELFIDLNLFKCLVTIKFRNSRVELHHAFLQKVNSIT